MPTATAPSTTHSASGPSASGTSSQSGHSLPAESGDALPDFATYVATYARKHPDVAALWCFGVGFVLGWKLKPW